MPGDHAGPRFFVAGHANGVDAMNVALQESIPTTQHLDARNPFDGKLYALGLTSFVDDIGDTIIAQK
eukprot:9503504-Pyramimonas_sp.AAC.1